MLCPLYDKYSENAYLNLLNPYPAVYYIIKNKHKKSREYYKIRQNITFIRLNRKHKVNNMNIQ